jgi:hypothetical protein
MNILLGSSLKLKLRYVTLHGVTLWYQRKVPLDLLPRYAGKRFVKENLKTTDPKIAARKVEALNKHYEATWEAMRNNSSITPEQVRQSAITLLAQSGLKPLPHVNPEYDLENFYETVLEPKRLAYAEGDDHVYEHPPTTAYLSETEQIALSLLNDKPVLRLSNAVDVYLNHHQKKNDEKFCASTKRNWGKLVSILGDKEFSKVTRADANLFIQKVLAEGSKTTTARRQANTIKAVFNSVIVEKELNRANPFQSLKIAGLGEDSEERIPFTNAELVTISKGCKAKDDDMRWAIALQVDIGSRVVLARI